VPFRQPNASYRLAHGVHHRGQAALLLRLLGHAPGNFDMLIYYAEKRGSGSRG
jgi:uncharacterized damage-inducible protein DinB